MNAALEPRPGQARLRFQPQQRIRRSREFGAVRAEGVRQRGPGFTVQVAWRKELPGPARLGLVASKRTGNAVARNRCKRLIREIFRTEQERWPEHVDIVVIAHSEMVEDSSKELRGPLVYAIRGALKRLQREQPRGEKEVG